LYRGDPNWIPPLRQTQKEMVGYAKSPFYEDAEVQTFLAYRKGEVVGRIAAILNHAHNRFQKELRGFFGFFESIDDQSVAHALLDAARAWLADRNIQDVRGPMNPCQNHECGLLVEGFHIPPTFMMTYNPPYYARLLETYGFGKAQDLLAYYGHIDMLPKLDKKLGFIAQESQERFNIKLRPLDKKRFRQDVELFLELYNHSMVLTWGFVPMSEAEIKHTAAAMKWLIIPELTVIAEVDGKPIGAVFGLPDYNPRIKAIDGRLFPFGIFKLLSRKQDFRRARVLAANVLPEYQHWGVGLVLLRELVPKVLGSGLQEVEFSWVMESNKLSRGSLEKGGALLEKRYRLYDFPAPVAAT
jgi:GNAT superfamily N-acetyltransferase